MALFEYVGETAKVFPHIRLPGGATLLAHPYGVYRLKTNPDPVLFREHKPRKRAIIVREKETGNAISAG